MTLDSLVYSKGYIIKRTYLEAITIVLQEDAQWKELIDQRKSRVCIKIRCPFYELSAMEDEGRCLLRKDTKGENEQLRSGRGKVIRLLIRGSVESFEKFHKDFWVEL